MSTEATKADCRVTHAPGGCYVCWTHRQFMPWSKPFVWWAGCELDHYGYESARRAAVVGTPQDDPREGFRLTNER